MIELNESRVGRRPELVTGTVVMRREVVESDGAFFLAFDPEDR